jgi:hypothetical protein
MYNLLPVDNPPFQLSGTLCVNVSDPAIRFISSPPDPQRVLVMEARCVLYEVLNPYDELV